VGTVNRRTLIDGITTVVILATCGVLVWSALGQSGAKLNLSAPPIPAQALSLENAAVTGDWKAHVAVIVFSDFQCPFCGKFAREVVPQLRSEFVDSGRVLLAFRQFPLSIHKDAEPAAVVAECARQQGKFWQMHDLLFADQRKLDSQSLAATATSLGLDESEEAKCIGESGPARVKDDSTMAAKLNLTSTPTVLVGVLEPNREVKVLQVLTGAKPLPDFEAALNRALSK
jgi:protein-disulfide isomerase